MNIVINQKNFLPHRDCDLELKLTLGKILIVQGENGIGKSSLSRWIKDHYSSEVTLIEQSPLIHFYNRKLIDLKNILINSLDQKIDLNRFHQLWNDFRLHSIEEHLLNSLSGGENQSLKLAIGLAMKNRILILDEPSQYLDESRKKKLSQVLSQLKNDFLIIVIEHESSWLTNVENEKVVLRLNDRVIEGQYV
jgi:energy-coupling factor transporter ATP-binding protein EcfA2